MSTKALLTEYLAQIEAISVAAKTMLEAVPADEPAGYNDNPMMMRQSHNTHCVHLAYQVWSQMYAEHAASRRIETAAAQRQLHPLAATNIKPEKPNTKAASDVIRNALKQAFGAGVMVEEIHLGGEDGDGDDNQVSQEDVSARDAILLEELDKVRRCACPDCRVREADLMLQLGMELTPEQTEYAVNQGLSPADADPSE